MSRWGDSYWSLGIWALWGFSVGNAGHLLLAALVGFSRIYLGDHYPGDVLSGALSGMALAEIVQRVQRAVERVMGRNISLLDG